MSKKIFIVYGHHNIKKSFSHVIISNEFKDSHLHVFVVSELKKSLEGELEIKLLNFNSEIPIKRWSQKIKIKSVLLIITGARVIKSILTEISLSRLS